jgi:galactokinase
MVYSDHCSTPILRDPRKIQESKKRVFGKIGSCFERYDASFDGLTNYILVAARGSKFWRYVACVAYLVFLEHEVGGLSIDNYKTTLPVKKGLSSSAAVCVLV